MLNFIRNRIDDLAAPKRMAQLKENYGLESVHDDGLAEFAADYQQMSELYHRGAITEMIDRVATAEGKLDRLPNARSTHFMLWLILRRWMGKPKLLPTIAPLSQQAQDNPNYAAAVAMHHLDRAWIHRGHDYVGDDPGADFDAMNDELERALRILQYHAKAPSWLWCEANFHVRCLAGNLCGEEVIDLYEPAWRNNRYDPDGCATVANFLMPRWYGNGYEDLERFARQAVDHTEDEFGQAMYAWTYYGITGDCSNAVEETLCDQERLRRACQDMLKQFPHQQIVNECLAVLSWIEDRQSCSDLIHAHLRQVVLESWSGDTPQEREEDAWDTIEWATVPALLGGARQR